MVDDRDTPDEAALAVVARHALHDEELVAALATDGLDDPSDVARARSLVERCTACHALLDDVTAISDVLKIEARATIPAPRDFRLTVDDARRLGGTVAARGFLGSLRRSMVSFGTPIGASMAALGIVGLLVGSVSLGAATGTGPSAAGTRAAATNPPVEIQAGAGNPDHPKSTDQTAAIAPGASATGSDFTNEAPRDSAAPAVNPAVWLLGASVLLLVGGIGLLVVVIRRSP